MLAPAWTSAPCCHTALSQPPSASRPARRHVERPQRPAAVWRLDVGKQVVGMGAAHACGLIIAILAHHRSAATSQCAWYFVAYVFDTSVGLVLTLALHKAALGWAGRSAAAAASEAVTKMDSSRESWQTVLAECGSYGDPIDLWRWAVQASEWTACVVIARAGCGCLVLALGPVLASAAAHLDLWFDGHPSLLLAFVMVCCPLAMNAAQLVAQDVTLKVWRGGERGGQALGPLGETGYRAPGPPAL